MNTTTCSADGCEHNMAARGLCSTHYSRWRLRGDQSIVLKRGASPERMAIVRQGRDVTPITGCQHTDRKHFGKGLCAPCYTKKWIKEHPDANSGPGWVKRHPKQSRIHRR